MKPPVKTLVTGADGFIGSAVCSRLVREGHDVVAATRTLRSTVPGCEMVAVGAVGSETDWSQSLVGVSAVVHLVGVTHSAYGGKKDELEHYENVNALGTLNLARQAKSAGVSNFVFMSTIKVNGEKTVGSFDQMTSSRKPEPKDHYGRTKYQAEKLLESVTGMTRVVLRPPLVYGPGQKGNLDLLCRTLLKRIPLPLHGIKNKRSFIYVENLVGAVLAGLNRKTLECEIFTLADITVSTTELVLNLAENLHVRATLFHLPPSVLKFLAACVNRRYLAERLVDSLVVNTTDAHSTLKWAPEFSFQEALYKTGKWYRNERN